MAGAVSMRKRRLDPIEYRLAHDQVAAFAHAIRTRVLPAFGNIDQEVKAEAERLQTSLSFGPEWDDPAEISETIDGMAVDYGLGLQEVADALLALSTAGLFHLFERQLVRLVREHALRQGQTLKPMKWHQLIKYLKRRGIDVTRVPSFSDIDELRLVANAVKHADGPSLEDLRTRKARVLEAPPGPFKNAFGTFEEVAATTILGVPLYRTDADFERYASAVLAFWDEDYWMSLERA